MDTAMKHFCIISNSEKDKNDRLVKKICQFLEDRSCSSYVLHNHLSSSKGIRHFTDISEIPEETECVIVLGGDGTMIQAAIDLVHKELPILGINTGTLGFLTEVDQNQIKESLERLLEGKFVIENRIMLKENKMFLQPDSRSSCYALNDMVISKRGGCRLITVSVYMGEELVDTYCADGLLVSTPTGSTGYNLSAGGPLMSPNTHAVVVTPICAHALNKRSLVIDASDTITLKIGQTKAHTEDLATFTADGRIVGELHTGDVLEICVPHAMTQLIKLSGIRFYERMREKLNEG